jgi:DNA-binding winged helix-turn-helix (wHTH) protein/pimeloyl-ACP methyl ester carboxylesterase
LRDLLKPADGEGQQVIYNFEGHSLDTARRELRSGEKLVAVEPQVFDVLTFLIRNSDRVVSKDDLISGVWNGRIVSDSTLSSSINAVRHVVGDSGDAQRFIRTVPRKGFRFVAAVAESGKPESGAAIARDRAASAALHQDIRYCHTRDGVRLAYAIAGEGPPMVKTGNWLHHLEYDWESPVWRHVLQGLARSHTLVRYDARGNGMSDWDVDELSLDAWVSDLETVVAAAGIERFPLLGISQGCAVSVVYAVRHPERVSHLILYGGYTLGAKKRTPQEKDMRNAMLTLARLEWGSDNPAFRQLFTGNFIPGATQDQADFFNELQRRTTSPECAARYMDATGDFDITDLVSRVTAPTLVMHVRGDLMVPLECGRELAAGIPGARLVTLPGQNHFFLEHEIASERFFEEVNLFLQ